MRYRYTCNAVNYRGDLSWMGSGKIGTRIGTTAEITREASTGARVGSRVFACVRRETEALNDPGHLSHKRSPIGPVHGFIDPVAVLSEGSIELSGPAISARSLPHLAPLENENDAPAGLDLALCTFPFVPPFFSLMPFVPFLCPLLFPSSLSLSRPRDSCTHA